MRRSIENENGLKRLKLIEKSEDRLQRNVKSNPLQNRVVRYIKDNKFYPQAQRNDLFPDRKHAHENNIETFFFYSLLFFFILTYKNIIIIERNRRRKQDDYHFHFQLQVTWNKIFLIILFEIRK